MAHGASYQDPTQTLSTKINNIGFVDDTTTMYTDQCLPTPLPPRTLLSGLEHDLQLWGELLHVAGGALELSKTTIHLLTWKFTSEGRPYPADNTDLSITLTCPHTKQSKTIHPDSNSELYKVLGFHIAMDQNMSTQYDKLLEKSHQIANFISGSSVDRKQALLTYHAVYIPFD